MSGDPYFGNVSLLLHMDGSNGSTTFTDSSSNALTVTANGNAQISTAQAKFDGTSGYFDGTGDYLAIAENGLFTLTGDFTIEFWIYLVTNPADRGVIANAKASFTGTASVIACNQSSHPNRYSFWNAPDSATDALCVTPTLTTGTWQHVAFVKSGTSIQGYLNGTGGASGTSSNTVQLSSSGLVIGQYWKGSVNAYLDDLRITQGVARYSTNFSIPTGPFPDRSVGADILRPRIVNPFSNTINRIHYQRL